MQSSVDGSEPSAPDRLNKPVGSNSPGRRLAAVLAATVAFVGLWFVFSNVVTWLFNPGLGQTDKLLPWIAFNFLGGAFIHTAVRKLGGAIARDYSRKLLTGLLVSLGIAVIAVTLLGLLVLNRASVSLLLIWTALGDGGFLVGAVTEEIMSRKKPSKAA